MCFDGSPSLFAITFSEELALTEWLGFAPSDHDIGLFTGCGTQHQRTTLSAVPTSGSPLAYVNVDDPALQNQCIDSLLSRASFSLPVKIK